MPFLRSKPSLPNSQLFNKRDEVTLSTTIQVEQPSLHIEEGKQSTSVPLPSLRKWSKWSTWKQLTRRSNQPPVIQTNSFSHADKATQTSESYFRYETFLRFNALANTLEALKEVPDELTQALKSPREKDEVPTLSSCVRTYTRGGSITLFAIGEALAELVGSGKLSPDGIPADSGIIDRDRLTQARLSDHALDVLMNLLLQNNGEIRAADSPLAWKIKDVHSIEYMRLCSRSSLRPSMEMPGLRYVIDDIKLKDEKPFEGVHIFQTQHGFDADESQARAVFELGAQPQQLWYFPKTGARPIPMDRLKRMGVRVHDNPFDLRHLTNPYIEPLMQFFDDAFGLKGLPLEQQIAHLRKFEEKNQNSNLDDLPDDKQARGKVLLVDEGFKIGQALLDLQLSTAPQEREKYNLIARLCRMVAHTEGDIIKGKKAFVRAQENATRRDIAVPILPRTINMAQSRAKKLEGFCIGHDVWMSIRQLLDMLNQPEAIMQRPKEALIIGYGAVSAKAQPQLQAGYDVWIWDTAPAALLQAYKDHAKQLKSGIRKIHIPVSRDTLERIVQRGGSSNDQEFIDALDAAKKEWFSHGHLVIGNTGAPEGCLQGSDFDLLPDGALLTSGASGDYEFGTTNARKNNPRLTFIAANKDGETDFPIAGSGTEFIPLDVSSRDKPYLDHQVYETGAGTSSAKRFMILRGGYVVNRLYGMPSRFIDLTKSIMLRSMYEAIQPYEDSPPDSGLWLVDPDSDIQQRIIGVIDAGLAADKLGSLEAPNFEKVDSYWHRGAESPSTHTSLVIAPNEPAYTSERYVQTGHDAYHTYNISPLSFALICEEGKLENKNDLQLLQQALFPQQKTNGTFAIEEIARQRNVAHTLYAIFANDSESVTSNVEEKVDTVRRALGIDDTQWSKLCTLPDTYGLCPSDYATLPDPLHAHTDNNQIARKSMQECISVLTITRPTQEQLKGDQDRKLRIRTALENLGE